MGGMEASLWGMIIACLPTMIACGGNWSLFRFHGGFFRVPAFVASLGIMMVASGFAYMLSGGLSIYQLPDSFDWLGRGDDLFGIPNAVVLMIALYFGVKANHESNHSRSLYLCGGNAEAARLLKSQKSPCLGLCDFWSFGWFGWYCDGP